jgi:heme/copper-type cytochrome/quinol oxidase subunit 3
MSTDTAHETAHGHDGGHHEAPEVVDHRQRMALWLFIGGDIVTTAAIIFTYLYLRAVNTGGHWMSMVGYQGHSYAYYEGIDPLPAATLIHVQPMSASFNWLVTGVVVLSALILWAGEKALRSSGNARTFSVTALLATAVAIVATALSIVQLRHLPEIYAVHADSHVMAYTTYDSAMMFIIGSAVVHFIILAFLGLGLTIRAARGAITGQKWFQARLVRIFWVWVAVSAIVLSALTTTVNTVH